MWEKAQVKYLKAASEHHMPSPQVHVGKMRFPPCVVDDRIPSNEKYYPINYINLTMEKPKWRKDPRVEMELTVKHAQFFICKQKVTWKIEHTMTCNNVINKLYRAKTPQEHTLPKHCFENKH